MESIIQKEEECYFCGKTTGLEIHHVLGGVANRKISDAYGLVIFCCPYHHRDPKNGVQYNPEMNLKAKRDAQLAFQSIYGHSLWMRLFRKNYLGGLLCILSSIWTRIMLR